MIVVKLFGLFTVLTVSGVDIIEEDDDEESRIEGGSAHNFERDVNPVAPEDRYQWEWDDKRKFGFGA